MYGLYLLWSCAKNTYTLLNYHMPMPIDGMSVAEWEKKRNKRFNDLEKASKESMLKMMVFIIVAICLNVYTLMELSL